MQGSTKEDAKAQVTCGEHEQERDKEKAKETGSGDERGVEHLLCLVPPQSRSVKTHTRPAPSRSRCRLSG